MAKPCRFFLFLWCICSLHCVGLFDSLTISTSNNVSFSACFCIVAMRRIGGRGRKKIAKKSTKKPKKKVLKKKNKRATAAAAKKLVLRPSRWGRGTPSSAEVARGLAVAGLPASARSVRRMVGPRAEVVRRHRAAAKARRLRAARKAALEQQEKKL